MPIAVGWEVTSRVSVIIRLVSLQGKEPLPKTRYISKLGEPGRAYDPADFPPRQLPHHDFPQSRTSRVTGRPLVSIITSSYNHEPYIDDYFQGILNKRTAILN